MKLLTFFFLLTISMALVMNIAYASNEDDDENVPNYDASHDFILPKSRFLVQRKPMVKLTCNKFPRICGLKGSPGPDCCKKQCVDVKNDRQNCGMCGIKCKYSQICCRGNCVNPWFDERHCGGCNKRCKKGEFCVYGMCNYA